MSELKFEVGKCYRSRCGDKYRVVATDCNFTHPIVAIPEKGIAILVTREGFFGFPNDMNGKDLIAPWLDAPEVEWAAMPKWANYVSKDSSGNWNYSIREPYIESGESEWMIRDGCFSQIPNSYCPKWSGDWRQSLVKRPEVKP